LLLRHFGRLFEPVMLRLCVHVRLRDVLEPSAVQVALFEALRLRWSERKLLQAERERLLADLSPKPASARAASSAVPAAPHAASSQPAAAAASSSQMAGGSQAAGFIATRSAAPAPAPPVLTNVQPLGAEVVVVRGVCDGCGQNVMSNDEGRQREDDKYYHLECVKGYCVGCGRIVHANADRVKVSGAYWHRDCS
jgi:hypothetical protein